MNYSELNIFGKFILRYLWLDLFPVLDEQQLEVISSWAHLSA